MYRSVRWVRLLALVPVFQFAACATITTGVDPFAKGAGVDNGARIMLRGNTEGVTVYNADGQQLRVVLVNDATVGQAIGNAAAQSAAGTSGGTYTTTERMSPAVFAHPKQDQTLRLVRRDGSSVVVQRPVKLGKRYVAVDWILFAPTLGLSLAIDWWTGQWGMFEPINVDVEFQKAAASSGNSR